VFSSNIRQVSTLHQLCAMLLVAELESLSLLA
jgi:hypothetical protein